MYGADGVLALVAVLTASWAQSCGGVRSTAPPLLSSGTPAQADGAEGDDTLIGGWSDDTLIGGPGDDEMDGGRGNDVVTETGDRDFTVRDQFRFAMELGGDGLDAGYGVATDAAGNLYVTGEFEGTVDFDPGPAAFELTSAGDSDAFVAKYSSRGELIWACAMGGPYYDAGKGIAVDGSGQVYTTGYFEDTADFDPGAGTFNLTSAGWWDVFVLKLDTSGNFVWARSMGGTDDDVGNGIAVDGSGNVCTTGYFWGTADFDPGAGTFDLTSAGSDDIFISKLDSSGNFVWAGRMGGTGSDWASAITVDSAGNVYTTGAYEGTADFDPGPETFNLSTARPCTLFVCKLDSSGVFVWADRVEEEGPTAPLVLPEQTGRGRV